MNLMIYFLLICLIIHLTYYLILFSRLAFFNETEEKGIDSKDQVSIIICYHNEENVIDENLPHIINQKANEIILVDDNSNDKTLEKLKTYESKSVRILPIIENHPGKKFALSRGIDAALNDSILLTDADCKPASEHWASLMNQPSDFVLGYGPMSKEKGLVALFSQYETYLTALQYLSYALAGIPYMGVGRNMKINRQTVCAQRNKVKGSHVASGDDDLTINALANRDNTSICIHPESFVYSKPKTSLKAFLNQKTRHISTSVYYKPLHKILLSLFSGSQILFYLLFIIGLLSGTIPLKIALILLLIKWFAQQMINYFAMKKLKEENLFWKIPVLDILFFVYLLVLPFYYLFNKNNTRWS